MSERTTDISFKINGGHVTRTIERVDRQWIDALSELPTSILSDTLDRFNAFASGFSCPTPARFAGSAFTVEEIEAGNLMSHLALKYVEAGDVLVIDAKGILNRASWGGLQTFSASRKGVVAVIVDGAIRDVDDVITYGVPVYSRAVTPAGPHKGWGGRVNAPVSCGGLVIEPGDVIVGDHDGIVVVPRSRVEDTVRRAQAKVEMEKAWFAAVEAGEDTADFLGFTAQAERYGIRFDGRPGPP